MIRITGGEWRGRALKTPRGQMTRPTQAKMRQALFNSIQTRISGAQVLDLFAGSGALGFEALSRGAAEVTFVESAPPVVRVIRENAQDLKTVEAIRVLALPAERALRELAGSRFDLVFADPPYADGWEKTLLEWDWSTLLNEDALVCLEWSPLVCKAFADGALPESVGPLVKAREKAYGETVLSHFRYNSLGDATSGDAVS